MASIPAADPEPEPPITAESLPVIDLRGLTQAELYKLSRCTKNPSRFDSDVAAVKPPTIDRSIFNESAGSRKQTFSRVRFTSDDSRRRNSPRESDLEREKSPQTVAALMKLFGLDASASENEEKISGSAESIPPN